MNPESLVSIRKDLDNGVATISVREGSGQLSLEVEGGRDGEYYRFSRDPVYAEDFVLN